MIGITILLAAFAIAMIGILRDNKADSAHRAIFGLNRVGLLLVSLSLVGLCAGVAKEISSARSARTMKASEDVRDRKLYSISIRSDVAEAMSKHRLLTLSIRSDSCAKMA